MAVYHKNRTESPAQTARRWIKHGRVIVDTETTGLGNDAQIVEIAIINLWGEVLLSTLVKPTIDIPEDATSIHGITNEMVSTAPTWPEVLPKVFELIGDQWIAYNAPFDMGMIERNSQGLDCSLAGTTALCAMRLYAEFNAEWDANRCQYKWKKLVEAAEKLNAIPDDSFGLSPHRALYDCYMTLGVVRAIAEGDL
ncbi:TPA: 3'-5' exonuclease [Citrobacter koseri]|nr:3'-5' exonuclease [Citrobacter koseri]